MAKAKKTTQQKKKGTKRPPSKGADNTKGADSADAESPRAGTASGRWRTLNRVQLAALMGVHPDTVTDYARSGMPVQTAGGRGKESAYDAVECLAWWRQQHGRNAKEAAQTKLFERNAELAALKLAREQGGLIAIEQVIRDGQHAMKGWAAMVRAWPRRLLHAGFIAREQERGVGDLVRELLLEISGWRTIADIEASVKKAEADAA